MKWDSAQYLKFKRERTQPAIDLSARIPLDAPRKVLDIGCGPGNSTRVLKDRFPNADILGIDSSAEMIAAAIENCPDLRFDVLDAGGELDRLPQDFDVVFSNACIQWIPDHPRLLRKLLSLLRTGGVLALQIPVNEDEPIQKILDLMVTEPRWRETFPHPRVFYRLKPGAYVDLLSELSVSFTVWETTYYHILHSHEDILEWYRGTGLRPYLSALPEERAAVFERDVFRQIVEQYPKQKNGDVIFRFPRFFILATVGGDIL